MLAEIKVAAAPSPKIVKFPLSLSWICFEYVSDVIKRMFFAAEEDINPLAKESP